MTGPRMVPPGEARRMEEFGSNPAAYGSLGPHVAERIRDLAHTAAVLGEQRDAVLALHRPQQDQPGSLVSSSYCSCGAREVKVMEDGYASILPAAYPCPTARALGVTA